MKFVNFALSPFTFHDILCKRLNTKFSTFSFPRRPHRRQYIQIIHKTKTCSDLDLKIKQNFTFSLAFSQNLQASLNWPTAEIPSVFAFLFMDWQNSVKIDRKFAVDSKKFIQFSFGFDDGFVNIESFFSFSLFRFLCIFHWHWIFNWVDYFSTYDSLGNSRFKFLIKGKFDLIFIEFFCCFVGFFFDFKINILFMKID